MENKIDNLYTETTLSELYGLAFGIVEGNNYIDIRPLELHLGEGFVVRIYFTWRSLKCEFLPDNYAASLISAMGNASKDQWELFSKISTSLKTHSNIVFEMSINGMSVQPEDTSKWPYNWRNLTLTLKIMPFVFEKLNKGDIENIIIEWGGKLLSMILTLLPMEEISEEASTIGLPEGAVTRIEVNKYERNLINRQTCLLLHGSNCKICGFNFEKVFGNIGKGFIHVHHLTPVSSIGPDYSINPANDLVPVCPNCHAMLHKRNPPFTIEQLRELINKTE